MADASGKQPNADVKTNHAGLLDLLICGGLVGPISLLQKLALHLLYAPLPTDAVPEFSAAAVGTADHAAPANRSQHMQLAAPPWQFVPHASTDVVAAAVGRFRQYKQPPMTAGEQQSEVVARKAWRMSAAAKINELGIAATMVDDDWKMYTGGIDCVGGRLGSAAFWIRQNDLVLPAYALYWYGPNSGFVRFAVRINNEIQIRRLFSGDGGVSDDDHPKLQFDDDCYNQTVQSTLYGVTDRSTGKRSGLAPIRAGLSTTSSFPAELANLVLDYLLLPNASAELLQAVEQASQIARLVV
jgi:hypothetical protein